MTRPKKLGAKKNLSGSRASSSSPSSSRSSKSLSGWWWIPNAITTVRLLLLVPFVYFLTEERFFVAAIVYAAALVTDVDGAIARRYKWTTSFGAVYDPLVDGLFLIAGSVLLVGAGLIPLVPLALYFVSVIFRLVPSLIHLKVTRSVQSTRISKLTAFCGYGAVLLAALALPAVVTGSLLLLGAVLNVVITVRWMRRGRFVLRRAQ